MDHNEAGILSLPTEMLQEIILHLNVRDILACSKVCKTFYDAINRDFIWRPLCEKTPYALIDYVRSVPSTVVPVFAPPQESLAPLCEWRVVYMKLSHLKRNFTNGNITDQYYILSRDRKNYLNHYLIGDLLLISNLHCTELQVWIIRTQPRLLGTIFGAWKNELCSMYADNTTVVFIQRTVLEVYRIIIEGPGEVVCLYRGLIDGNQDGYIPGIVHFDNWYESHQRPIYYEASCLTGIYFASVVCVVGEAILYLWNKETGEKVHQEIISRQYVHDHEDECCRDFPFVRLVAPVTETGDILVVLYREFSDDYGDCEISHVIFSFNLKTFVYKFLFTDSQFEQPDIYYEGKNIVFVEVNLFKCISTIAPHPSKVYISNNLFCNTNLFADVIAFICGEALHIFNNDMNGVYQISLIKNNRIYTRAPYYLCDWNIVLVAFFDADRGVSLIEMHDYVARTLLKTFECNGKISGLSSPLHLLAKNITHNWYHFNVSHFW